MNNKELESYITSVQSEINDTIEKYGIAIWDNPTNIGKVQIIRDLIARYGKTLIVSQTYDINRQWNSYPDVVENSVFMTYTMLASIAYEEICDFCSPYKLIIFDEAHHTGAAGYISNVTEIIDNDNIPAKIFGVTTHTKRYSDSSEDVADTVFHGHKISGITFEEAITKGFLPQFDYVSALYSLPKDIGDIIARSSLAKKIISDSRLVQVNDEGIRNIIKKHMPGGNRKVMYFAPSIEDCEDAEKLSKELGYGATYVINYTKTDAENREALDAYNNAKTASIVCISKFNEGDIPKGTNTVVILRKTMTINVFERQILAALSSAAEKPIIYDFVSNIDNLIYSSTAHESDKENNYVKHISALCMQSIVTDYTRPWISVFKKIRDLTQNGWTEAQDNLLSRYYPKYGENVYKYITSHTKKECLFRAEILGLVYEPAKEEDIKEQESVAPFTLNIMETLGNPDGKFGFSEKFIEQFVSAYKQSLEIGYFENNILREIRQHARTRRYSITKDIEALISICIKYTVINVPEKSSEIEDREKTFRNRIVGYTETLYRKASDNIVVINGKAYSKEDANKAISEQEKAKAREGKTLVGDTYMGSKSTVAGKYGDSEIEHVLYKTYMRMATNRYRTSVVNTLANEYSFDEVVQKIDDLRNSRMPWTDKEIELITKSKKGRKIDTYAILIKAHSDLDILEKAKELQAQGFIVCATQQTNALEKSYDSFLQEYKEVATEKENERKRIELQKQQEAENRIKKAAEKERLKNMKAKVLVVSGKTHVK